MGFCFENVIDLGRLKRIPVFSLDPLIEQPFTDLTETEVFTAQHPDLIR